MHACNEILLFNNMPHRIILNALAEKLGDTFADFTFVLVEPLRDFACELWERFPDQITQQQNIPRSFQRGYMSYMCQDKPQPTPPQVPFTGGQCPGVSYDVTINIIAYNIGNCQEILNVNPVFTVIGPVEGTVFEVTTVNEAQTSCNGLSNTFVDLGEWVLRSASPDLVVAVGIYKDALNAATPPLSSAIITDVVRTDGQPDTCGDPPVRYPETNPTVNDYSTTINFTAPDGGSLDIDVVYQPDNYNFPLEFDVGGLDVSLDLGGFEFNFSPRNPDGTLPRLPTGDTTPSPTPLDDSSRQFPRTRYAPPEGNNYDVEVKDPTDPKEEEVSTELRFVKVTLSSTPTNVKRQWGGGAPDVIYAGWFEFTNDGYNFPRQPIHFAESLFETPEGATGYAYTLYEGIVGFATVYTQKVET